MDLGPDEIERYARHIVLREVGGPGQAKLKQARVLVVGAGGLGAPLLLYLAAAGVGTLGVVDDDTVSLSNLQRQVIHGTPATSMLPKVESAAAAIRKINPHVRVVPHAERLTAKNALAIIGGYDIVADGSDNFATRYLVPTPATSRRSRWSRRRSAPSTARSPRSARTSAAPTEIPIRPIGACFPSRRRPAPCRPARRPASSARCPASSAR